MPQKKAAKKAAPGKKAATKKKTTNKSATKKAPKTAPRPMPKIDLRSYINELNKRAYEIFQQRGASHGSDWEDWFRAEKELKKKFGIME
jgi:hypothetical protein